MLFEMTLRHLGNVVGGCTEDALSGSTQAVYVELRGILGPFRADIVCV